MHSIKSLTAILFCLLSTMTCCAGFSKSDQGKEKQIFAAKLKAWEFGDLFVYPRHDETIENIWDNGKNEELLNEILYDSTIDREAQFIACVVLFKKRIEFLKKHKAGKIAEVYADALAGNYTRKANPWGLLYGHDSGSAGEVFLFMGKASIPPLMKLLNDENTHLHHHGSEAATIGYIRKYRVKDYAAYYIGEIIGFPHQYHSTFTERDKQIDELKKRLEELNFSD